jgi:hypothetical protein
MKQNGWRSNRQAKLQLLPARVLARDWVRANRPE